MAESDNYHKKIKGRSEPKSFTELKKEFYSDFKSKSEEVVDDGVGNGVEAEQLTESQKKALDVLNKAGKRYGVELTPDKIEAYIEERNDFSGVRFGSVLSDYVSQETKDDLENVRKAGIVGGRFKNFDQCFLLVNHGTIEQKLLQLGLRDFSNYNFSLLDTVQNESTILEQLVISNYLQNAFEITQEKLAYLVPKLKVYIRKFSIDDEQAYVKQPLIFDTHLSSQNLDVITQKGAGRAAGVGIKSFDWTWRTFTGHERDQDIQAHLKLTFQSIEDFIQDSFITKQKFNEINKMESNNKSGNVFIRSKDTAKIRSQYMNTLRSGELNRADGRFSDLIPGLGLPGVENQVEIVTGWNVPPNKMAMYTETEIKTIEKMSIILTFTVTGYNIAINQNGTIEVTVRLQGRTESILSSQYFDIFLLSNYLRNIKDEVKTIAAATGLLQDFGDQTLEDVQELITSNDQRVESYKKAMDEAAARGTEEDYEVYKKNARLLELTEELNERVENVKTYVRYSALPILLHDEGNLLRITTEMNLDRSFSSTKTQPDKIQITKYNETGTGDDVLPMLLDPNNKEINDEDTQQLFLQETSIVTNPNGTTSLKHNIDFFYVGDLLNILSRLIYDNNRLKNMRLLVGPINISGEQVNMADIPISYQQFMLWYWKKITTISDEAYPMKDFMKDFFNEFLLSMYKSCLGAVDKQVDFNVITFTINSNEEVDPITRKASNGEGGVSRIDLDTINLREYSHSEGKFSYEYMLLYSVQHVEIKNRTVNIIEDNKRGIIHLKIGSDRGLMKYVTFDRDEIPEFDTHRTLSGEVLGYLWKTKIHLYGAPKFFPTQTIYIDPTLIGSGDPIAAKEYSKYLGIGGYHIVTKVSCRINFSGKYETVLETIPLLTYEDGAGRTQQNLTKKERENIQNFRQRYLQEKTEQKAGIEERSRKAAEEEKTVTSPGNDVKAEFGRSVISSLGGKTS